MWTKVDTDRWIIEQPDGTTNYLLRSGKRLLELHVDVHVATLHEYTGDSDDDSSPLTGAVHRDTSEIWQLAGADESQAWRSLAGL